MLHPCVVSPEKKRNINNDLAVLPSHDSALYCYMQILLFPTIQAIVLAYDQ